jgi:hypothetical protein
MTFTDAERAMTSPHAVRIILEIIVAAFASVIVATLYAVPVAVPCTVIGYGPGGVPEKSQSCFQPIWSSDYGPALIPAAFAFVAVLVAALAAEVASRWMARRRSAASARTVT